MSESDDTYIRRWVEIKEQITSLQKQSEIYRKHFRDVMASANTLSSPNWIVTKTTTSRKSLSKKDVPTDIWNAYHTTTTFDTFTVRPREEKRRSRSPPSASISKGTGSSFSFYEPTHKGVSRLRKHRRSKSRGRSGRTSRSRRSRSR